MNIDVNPSRFTGILNYSSIAACLLGGIFFVAGSVVYWPSLSYLNPNLGGIFFIIGSCLFFFSDLAGAYLDPRFSPFRPLRNIGCHKSLITMLGNIAFIVGSVYFLPELNQLPGDDIFVLASIFILIPQFAACWGLSHISPYTAEFYF